MEETKKTEAHLTSPTAFVEGGIQEACDDACSICLETFCESDPSTVTSCKHEYHLQCILEWCQRSSQCPMCWQSISLKDPTSQELLEAVEQERSFRFNPSRNATIFHHPTLGDFELQQLPVGASDAELEERIIQHLAAAAAMGRRHIARSEGQRNRPSSQGRPQFLVISSQPNGTPAGSISSSPTQGEDGPVSAIPAAMSSSPTLESYIQPTTPLSSDTLTEPVSASASASSVINQHENSLDNRRSSNQSSPNGQDRAGPSELQSFSESIKSKFNAVSMRYRESISKSTRGWKERFLSRNATMEGLGSEVRREVNAGTATVSRMMDRIETRDNSRTGTSSVPHRVKDDSVTESNNQQLLEGGGGGGCGCNPTDSNTNAQASCAASSGST